MNRTQWIVIAITALVVLAFSAAASFAGGKSTRMSDAEVALKVRLAVDRAERKAADERRDALTGQRQDFRERLKKVRKRARNAGYRVGKESGYQDGNNDGYAAGNSAGYSSGHAEGVDEGIEEGSDELSCSDDLDVPLPPCSYGY
jgi:flagellar biosynthesis/type III secretory pathway protein FliH